MSPDSLSQWPYSVIFYDKSALNPFTFSFMDVKVKFNNYII